MKLFLVRHGETDFNQEMRFQGISIDNSLNQKGIEQSKQLSKLIHKKSIKIDYILTSSLKRTIETAGIINKNFHLDIIKEDLLLERDFGLIDGKKYSEVNIKDVESNPQKYKYELEEHLLNRANQLLKKLKGKYQNKNILLVSHGGFIKGIISVILKMNYKTALIRLKNNNASLTTIDFSTDTPIILKFNE